MVIIHLYIVGENADSSPVINLLVRVKFRRPPYDILQQSVVNNYFINKQNF